MKNRARINALLDAYKKVDKIAARDVRFVYNHHLVDHSELDLHMSSKRPSYKGLDKRFVSTYNYSGVGQKLMDQATDREQSGELEKAMFIRPRAYEIMGLHVALMQIAELAAESTFERVKRKLPAIAERALQNMYYPAP